MCTYSNTPPSLRAKRSNPGAKLMGKNSKTEISQTRLLRRYAPRNDKVGVLNRDLRVVATLIAVNMTNTLTKNIEIVIINTHINFK